MKIWFEFTFMGLPRGFYGIASWQFSRKRAETAKEAFELVKKQYKRIDCLSVALSSEFSTARAAFEAGAEMVYTDIEEGEGVPKYSSYEDWYNQMISIK